jgi:uncharacterized protein
MDMRMNVPRMALDMKSMEHGTNRVRVEVPLRSIDWRIAEVEPAADVGILDLLVEYSEKSIVVTGMLDGQFMTPCARCLEPAVFRSTAGIRRVYTSDMASLEEDDVDPIVVEDDCLVILDAVRESVILSIPCKPLCRPDCPGICYN